MPSSPGRYSGGRLLILDTGAIRELVLFHAVHEFRFERLRSDLRFIKDHESHERCSQFISSFRRRTTSASVVAELYYWIRGTDDTGQERLWYRVYEEFRSMGMDEEVVKLLEMHPGLVERFGPVDVSLMELARRHAIDTPLLLTMDGPLKGECKKAGLLASHVQEVTLMLR